jgi:hypothetical protein
MKRFQIIAVALTTAILPLTVAISCTDKGQAKKGDKTPTTTTPLITSVGVKTYKLTLKDTKNLRDYKTNLVNSIKRLSGLQSEDPTKKVFVYSNNDSKGLKHYSLFFGDTKEDLLNHIDAKIYNFSKIYAGSIGDDIPKHYIQNYLSLGYVKEGKYVLFADASKTPKTFSQVKATLKTTLDSSVGEITVLDLFKKFSKTVLDKVVSKLDIRDSALATALSTIKTYISTHYTLKIIGDASKDQELYDKYKNDVALKIFDVSQFAKGSKNYPAAVKCSGSYYNLYGMSYLKKTFTSSETGELNKIFVENPIQEFKYFEIAPPKHHKGLIIG